jgi:O-antigen/teichoic acid export membrane protein
VISLINLADKRTGLKQLLLKNILWRGIYLITLFVLTLLISRYYMAAGSGMIYYNLTLLAWFILVVSYCLEYGMSYSLASGKISASNLTGLSLIWSVVSGILAFFMVGLLKKTSFIRASDISFFQISVFYVTGNLLITYFSALFYAIKDFVTPNVCQIINNCVLIFLIPKKPLGIIIQDHFINIYFLSFFLLGILLFLLFFVKGFTGLKIGLPDQAGIRMLLGLSTWAFFTNALSMLLYRVDYVFVKQYCNPLELGNYIQASKISQIFLVLPAVISATIFPMTAGGMLTNPVKIIQSLSRNLFFFTLTPAIVLIVTGDWLFPYVFGESFSLMYTPFTIMLPGILSFCVICPITAYYGGVKVLYVNFISLSISLIFVVVSDWLLVPLFGIRAAAIVSSLGYMGYAVCLIWFFNKDHKFLIQDFFTIRKTDFNWIQNLRTRNVSDKIDGNIINE